MKISNNIMEACTTLFYLNDLNIYVVTEKDSIVLSFEHNRLPHFLSVMQKENFVKLWEEAARQRRQCYLYRNELGLSYLAELFEKEISGTIMMVHGPFLDQTPDFGQMALFNSNKKIVMREFLGGLKLLSRSKIQSMANMIYCSPLLQHVDLYTFDEHQSYTNPPIAADKFKLLNQSDEAYDNLIALRYKLQREIMFAISQGNREKGEWFFNEIVKFTDFSERIPNQPVRVMKNLCIIFNTLFRIAAEKGGVPPFFLHHISEKFAIKIEQVNHLDALVKLLVAMYSEYCELVKHHQLSGYSLLVQKAVNFLKIHYMQPLNLEKISRCCFVHPAHLSRQFKKETGATLTDFLNKLRIDEAKKNLRVEALSIELIAENLGFNDASYFSRVFKKETGMSPTKYRNLQ